MSYMEHPSRSPEHGRRFTPAMLTAVAMLSLTQSEGSPVKHTTAVAESTRLPTATSGKNPQEKLSDFIGTTWQEDFEDVMRDLTNKDADR